ncbi:Protein of unknown function [Nitrosomonas ureae]|uniref:DUF3987 domain-containing protein n=1 Tax=Nitrosomonas ureae TaxID=44577 RepID=A0A285BYN9_9PROT|nr:DUF3987 domain-containing protein [Nitrosomonas ureae]SNX60382.1 Protein of unknown function [Nitrosomonas ureae]
MMNKPIPEKENILDRINELFSEKPSIDSVLDSNIRYTQVDLLQYIDDDHILKKLSIQVAKETSLPSSSVFLAGLGTFSSVAARKYTVLYEDGTPLPIGLYVVIEQPSGSGKSRCLKIFQKPFYDMSKEIYDEITMGMATLNSKKDKGVSSKDEDDELSQLMARLNAFQPIFTTNTTAEGLEKQLTVSNGFFSCISSEQGLFNVLFGNSYRTDSKVNNNDVVLNGFDAGWINSARVTRKGYCGRVVGSIVCFAQSNSIETLLNSSNGTGLSERFLMLVEPHSLGKRDHLKRIERNHIITDEYAWKCREMKDVIEHAVEFDELRLITIPDSGFLKINEFLNTIEKDLDDGGKYSHASLRGAASKVNMQIMKIAANLCLIDKNKEEFWESYEIDDKYIDSAINICNTLLEALLKLCQTKGIIGTRAEFASIILLFEDNNKPKTERAIIQSRSRVSPFKQYSGNKSELIRQTLNEMLSQNILTKSYCHKTSYYSLL